MKVISGETLLSKCNGNVIRLRSVTAACWSLITAEYYFASMVKMLSTHECFASNDEKHFPSMCEQCVSSTDKKFASTLRINISINGQMFRFNERAILCHKGRLSGLNEPQTIFFLNRRMFCLKAPQTIFCLNRRLFGYNQPQTIFCLNGRMFGLKRPQTIFCLNGRMFGPKGPQTIFCLNRRMFGPKGPQTIFCLKGPQTIFCLNRRMFCFSTSILWLS